MSKRKRRNEITTSHGMDKPLRARKIEQITIAEFLPNTSQADMQVHLLIDVIGIKDTLVMRFHSPDTIGDLIEQLNFYRNRVWPDADSLDFNKDF